MLRAALFLCLWALCAVEGQPVSCSDHDQCSEGYYCEISVHKCWECLSCQDLKRMPPLVPKMCIESVAECGACFKGLVVDRLGDLNAACVVSSAEEPGGTPHYVWWLGSTVIIFLALMIGIMVYIYLNPGIFENFKFGGPGQSGTVSTNIRAEARPNAPEAPPPYSPHHFSDIPYSSVRTAESPCPPHLESADQSAYTEEEEGPFIKPSNAARSLGQRETADRQAARPYNRPIYEREEPRSPEMPMTTEVTDNLAFHDEETVESTWTPSLPSNGDINANVNEASTGSTTAPNSNLPALLAAAQDDSLFEHKPPKQMRLQASPNYTNQDNSPGGDSNQGNFSGNQNGGPYNFIAQITNVFQFNRSS